MESMTKKIRKNGLTKGNKKRRLEKKNYNMRKWAGFDADVKKGMKKNFVSSVASYFLQLVKRDLSNN